MKARLDNMLPVPLDKLRADVPIPFPLYLLLKLNDRVVPIRKPGEALGEEKYKEFLSANLAELWVPSDFQQAFIEYLDKIEGKVNTLVETIEAASPASELAPPLENPQEVALVTAVLEDQGMSQEEKSEVLSAIGQDILRSLNQIKDRGDEPKKAGLRRCKQLADEILEIAYQHKSIYDEIVALRSSQEDMEHSMMVGTIAVMFALANGVSDKELLADITLAGLFHDIGLTKVNPKILLKPETSWSALDRQEYEGHIMASVALLSESSKEFNPAVFRMIQEHHENSDGSGFPFRRQGPDIAESSQIVHLANLFDRLCSGKTIGQELSPQEAFAEIGKIATNPKAVQEVAPILVRKIFKFMLEDPAQVAQMQTEMQGRATRAADENTNA